MTAERAKSKYAQKRESGKMMYGPGCCAHKTVITQEIRDKWRAKRDERDAQLAKERELAIASRRAFGNPWISLTADH